MRKLFIIFLCLSFLPVATKGQTIDDADLLELLQPRQAKAFHYWFDEASDRQAINSLSGTYTLDVSSLSDGLHTLHYMLVDEDGVVCSIKTGIFIKMEEALSDDVFGTPVEAKRFAYWFDEDSNNMQISDDLSGIYMLDVSALSDGLHTIHYHIVGDDGQIYGTTTTMFLKNEEQFAVHEPNKITKYMYWLNNDNSTVQTVTLDQPANPYSLISLLPLQRMPIRSSCFHFQVDDGVPTIYARNTFNIRFYDSKGEFVDNFMENERTFIDYGMSQQVEPVCELQESQTFERIGENEIRWYTLEAARGDSLSFKTDKACSIQLFSPSGENVYITSGAGSVKWDGCHAREDGTYYLALHDVTAKTGTNITLDYQHIDKYAILRQDVSVVGNGGYTTISFEGNGFMDLYAIDLVDAEQELINCIEIGFVNNTHVTPTFDFTEAKLGVYDAYFHFTEGDVVIKDAITVEEATDIIIKPKLETPSMFVGRGKPYYEIVVVCPNGGNNTAYGVPVEVSFKAPKGLIQRIDITNPEVPTLADILYNVELDEDELRNIKETSDQLGDTYDFIPEYWIDEITGQEMVTMRIYLALTIAPRLQNIVNFHVLASSDVETEVDCPIDWLPIFNIEKKDPVTEIPEICAGLEKLKCVTDGLATLSGAASTIGSLTTAAPVTGLIDCAISNIAKIYGKYTEVYCGRPKETFDPLSFKTVQKTASVWSPILSCALPMIPGGKISSKIVSAISGASTSVTFANTIEQCKYAFGEKKSGVSKRLYSLDPNDIIGYTSPSGSMYISGDDYNLYYTVEFENDPEEATAAAHEIVVTDQLDATKFDLSTFIPTRVKIGEKSAELNGDKNFITTIDLRPEIYAIAQVTGTYEETTGLAKWHIISLDPMTMEPIDDPMIGVLPINTDGLGIGEVSYDIQLREGLSHGTEIPNQATIVFDVNEPITTPVWTNIIDAVAPTSTVSDVEETNETTLRINVNGHDEDSGIWKYELYVQHGENAPWWKEGETNGTYFDFRYYGDIDYGFCVLATDSAGNVEKKELQRERSFMTHVDYVLGDVNGDGYITAQDASLVLQLVAKKITSTTEGIIYNVADVNGDGEVTAQDASLILQHVAKKIDLSNLNQ